ncbi:MAG: cofactor-independent phosphoglycerate mutase [Spirochaetes bacterium]|nr:cofactor-independent phosphoglycerate mutase [Spirochaetota bacterium]
MSRKILTIVCDGMADLPIEELDGKTPLEYVNPGNINSLVPDSIIGLARTVPQGMNPGSDTANLSIFGYNPEKYYTGRAPLEAVSMGINLGPGDAAFRCNLVNISDGIMNDFTADHIETAFSGLVMEKLNAALGSDDIEFHKGVSYRNALVWRNYPYSELPETVPPHDITNLQIDEYFPSGSGSDLLKNIFELSGRLLKENDFSETGFKGKPTNTWIWGGGFKPALDSFKSLYNLEGYTISAVDLIHGIGIAAGLQPKFVEGVTGYIDTNYIGKAKAAIECLKEKDYVFLHFESPDESGHEGNIEHKIKSIRDIDEIAISYLLTEIKQFDDITLIIMPDHPTPISLRTHTSDPVPFLVYSTGRLDVPSGYKNQEIVFNEKTCAASGLYIDDASTLLSKSISGKFE